MLRGTRATLRIKQGAEQNWASTLYVENRSKAANADFERNLRAAIGNLAVTWPGIEVKPAGEAWQIVIPEKYSIGHEAHFAQVTERYLRFLADGKLPAWEVPNMIAKYYTTTQAYAVGHGAR